MPEVTLRHGDGALGLRGPSPWPHAAQEAILCWGSRLVGVGTADSSTRPSTEALLPSDRRMPTSPLASVLGLRPSRPLPKWPRDFPSHQSSPERPGHWA